MNSYKEMWSVILLGALVNGLVIGEYDQNLDPGMISWQKYSWNEPIEMSSVNSGDSGVSISFNFRPSTTLSDGGIVEVHFPSAEFTLGDASCSGSVCKVSKKEISGDMSVTVGSVTLGSPGSYGPFKLLTRREDGSQIVDANYVFGHAVIAEAPKEPGSLTVETTATGDIEVSKGTYTLAFSFQLDSTDVWRDDLIVIEPPSWNDDTKADSWKLSGEPACEAKDPSQETSNRLFGPDGTSTSLSCFKDSQSNIVIYGIGKEILTDSSQIKIEVGSFSPPGAVYAASEFSWVLKVYRYGTKDLKLKYSGTGPNPTLKASSVASVTWGTVNSFSVSEVIPGMKLYNFIEFSLDKQLPNSGEIVVSFSSVTVDDSGYGCYLETTADASCAATASDVTITANEVVAQGTSFKVYLLSTLAASAKISTIEAKTTDNKKISEATDISYSFDTSDPAVYQQVDLAVSDDVSNLAGVLADTKSISFTLSTTTLPKNGDTFEIDCPFADASSENPSLGKIAISSSPKIVIEGESDDDNADSDGATTASVASGSLSSGVLTVTIDTESPDADSVSPTLVIKIVADDANSKVVSLPLVASNEATFYECKVKASLSGNSEDELSVGQFTVDNQKVETTAGSEASYFGFVCLSDSTTQDELSPLRVIFAGSELPVDIDDSYKIEVEFDASLSLGQSDISSLDIYSSLSAANAKASLAGGQKVTLSGVTVTKTDTLDVIIPANNKDISSVTSFKVYKDDETYSSIKNVILGDSLNKKGSAAGSQTSYSSTGSMTVSENGQDFSITTTSFTNSNKVVLSAGKGWDLTSATMEGTAKSFVLPKEFDSDFPVNIVVFDGISTSSAAAAVAGLVTPTTEDYDNSGDNNEQFYVRHTDESNPAQACANSGPVSVTVGAGSISNIKFTSKTETRTIDNIDSSLTVTFDITHAIPKDGKIEIGVYSEFDLSADAAYGEVTGLLNDDSQVSLSANSISISPAQAEAGSSISVKVHNVLLPSSAATDAQMITSIKTQADNSASAKKDIDSESTAANMPTQTFTDASSVDPGTSNLESFVPYPNIAGYQKADLSLKFKLSKKLLKDTLVEISPGSGASWTTDSWSENKCWSSISYKSCELKNSKIEIVLENNLEAETSWELYLDSAYNLPGSEGEAEALSIKATYNSDIVVVSDTSASGTYQVLADPAKEISGSLELSVTNEGMHSNYKFTFNSAVSVSADDELWIVFPKNYDAYIGDHEAKYPSCSENLFSISCSSDKFDSLSCLVDHWTVVLKNLASVEAETDIAVELQAVKNPLNTESAISGFEVLLRDKEGNYKAYKKDAFEVTLKDSPSSLSLKAVEAEKHEVRSSAKLEFEFILAADLDENDYLVLEFPLPFDLASDLTCASYYYESSEWKVISEAPCTVEKDSIKHQLAAHASSDGYWAKLEVEGVTLPSWGYSRSGTDEILDIDLIKKYPQEYSLWTKKFAMHIYDSVDKEVSYRSYSVLNSAYLGINNSRQEHTVDSYSPLTEGHTVVYSGTTKELSVSGNRLAAKSLTLSPSSEGNFNFTSEFEFKFWQMTSSIDFRISTPVDMEPGIYYLKWEVEEESHDGVDTDKYYSPIKTPIEVCNRETPFSVSVAKVPTLYIGQKSIPIKVELENSPASEKGLVLDITSPSGVEANPSSLSFSPGANQLYFELSVVSSYNSSEEALLSFEISGADSSVFSKPESKSLTIEAVPEDLVTASISVVASSDSPNAGSAEFEVDQNSLVYWWLSCEGTKDPSFDELKTKVASLIEPGDGTDYQEQTEKEYQSYEAEPAQGESVVEYLKRQYAEHCNKLYVGSQVVYEGKGSVNFDWLYADTSYNFGAFADNLVSGTPNNSTDSFKTTAMPAIHSYTVSVDQASEVGEAQADNIIEILADLMDLPPSWVQLYKYSASNGTEVITSEFEFSVLFDRANAANKPEDFVALSSQNKEALKESLVNENLVDSTATITVVGGSALSHSSAMPAFSETPSLDSETSSSASFKVKSASSSLVCGACAKSPNTAITPEQVLVGLSATNELIPYNCANFTTEGTLEVTGLEAETDYYCYLAICEDYPLWPLCQETQVTEVQAKTSAAAPEEDSEEDSASALSVCFLVALIFTN